MADTTRMRALKNLSNSLPVANSNVAQGQAAARDMQLQAAVQKAPAAGNVTQAAQATGAAVAQNAGQQMVQGAQQGLQQQQQVGQIGLAEQSRQGQAEVQGLASGAKEEGMESLQKLASLDARAKQELYDKQMEFAKDENGRTLFNEEQLADYAVANAQSDEQLRNYSMRANQASQRKLQMMETAYKKVQEDLNFKYAEAKQKGDQEAQKAIQQQQIDMQNRMQSEKAKAANKNALYSTVGTVAGAAGGAFFGPAGAMAGGAAGGAVGSMVGNSIG